MRHDSAAAVQLRVLFALVMREMTTRYGRNAGGYVWAILEPAGTVAILTLAFSAIARRPALGESFTLFFATGYMAFHVYADVSRGVSEAVSANRALLTFPRVTILDTVVSRFILHMITTLFVSTLVLGGAVVVFDEPVHITLSSIFIALGLAAALGLAVGFLNCSLFIYSPTWKTVFGIINRPLFLISGIFFVYSDLPSGLRDVAWWNPLIHVTALMRAGFYANAQTAFASPLFVVMVAAFVFLFGVITMRALRARMLDG